MSKTKHILFGGTVLFILFVAAVALTQPIGGGVGTGSVTVVGPVTPGDCARFVSNLQLQSNGAACQNLTLPLSVAQGGTGDTGTAWTPFTPAFSCGTATFTTNAARFKTIGKTAFIAMDLTIVTIGTCLNSIVYTPPVASFGGITILSGFNSTRNIYVGCEMQGVSTACIQTAGAAYLLNDRVSITGVYETQ